MTSFSEVFNRLYADKSQTATQFTEARGFATTVESAAAAVDAAVALILAESPAQAVIDQCTEISAQTAIIAAAVESIRVCAPDPTP